MRAALTAAAATLLVLAGCTNDSELDPVPTPAETTQAAVEATETPIALGEPFTIEGPNYTVDITIERVYIPAMCGERLNENPAIEADVQVTSGDGTREVLNTGTIRERTPDGYIQKERTVSQSCDGIDELGAMNAQTGDKYRGIIWLKDDVDPESEILINAPTGEGPIMQVFVLDLSELDFVSASTTPAATPADPAAASEPYVVECLFGTPGPSRMSDGTIRSTDYCFHEMGGPAYLEQEGRSGLGGASQQPAHDGVPIADGGTCPAALCGYGHDEDGNRNPSSGEIQSQYGCEQGYITDAELCAAVGSPIQ
ncbi:MULTISPECIES: hypothetical protein [unclassified Dietzia]|uniref:hypothetical protein n=1 Tax=unclassified Dietzia TaxID=2617939 RepID=UPI001315EB7D|nr:MULTISPECIES: hypothetical protein [unclassified Dietzia]QGW24505.1 hypothetical protein GJR88_02268 [Dietzia sp. DQ12-45-1b]